MEYEKETRRLRKSSGKQSEHEFHLDLGFNSLEGYINHLKSQPSIVPLKTQQKSIFDPDYDPAENRLIYLKEYIDLRLKEFDFFEAIDVTREKIDGWLKDGSEAIIDAFIQLVPKNSLTYHLLHVVKGAAPHLVPMIWFVLGLLGGLIFLFLNLPSIKDKLIPLVTNALKEFYRDIEDRGLAEAILKLKNSLSKTLDGVVEHYVDRLKNAKSIEEKEEVLGELVAAGIITVQTVQGVSHLIVKGGKAVAKIPGKVPPQVQILHERVAKQVEVLSTQLGPQKSAELVANLEKSSAGAGVKAPSGGSAESLIIKALEADQAARIKTGVATESKTVGTLPGEPAPEGKPLVAGEKNAEFKGDPLLEVVEDNSKLTTLDSVESLFGKTKTPAELKIYLQILNKYKIPLPKWAEKIAFDSNLKRHMSEVVDFTQKSGVTGGHNLESFEKIVKARNIQIVSKVEHSVVKGLYNIEYKIPAFDGRGNPIGFKGPFTKTVYDPNVISDIEMLTLAQVAANPGFKDALESGSRAYNGTAGGISFRVYVEKGIITNVHPKF